MTVHLHRAYFCERTVCGRRAGNVRVTRWRGLVTCEVCLRYVRARIARIVILEKRA